MRLGVRGTGGPDEVAILADWLIRTYTPIALLAVGLEEWATQLQQLPPITETTITGRDTRVYEEITRHTQQSALAHHRHLIDLLGPATSRVTDDELLDWIRTGQQGELPTQTLTFLRSGQFPGPAATWAYSTLMRCIAVLHLWGQQDKGAALAQEFRRTHNDALTRIFLECDVQLITAVEKDA